MVEDAGDAPEQVDVDILFPEDLVDVGTCAAELTGEPGNSTSLFVKRAFDKLSRMNHVILQVCVPRIPVGGTDYCNTGENI